MSTVSIIIPTYNRGQYLTEAITSALAQTLENLEVVVVDDGSTDNTAEVVCRIGDSRVRYIYQQNRGATAAFNRGIRESNGDYISILGSDDSYLPDALVPLVAELDRQPELGSVSGGYRYVDERGAFIREARPWESFRDLSTRSWLFWCPTILQSSIIRKSWFDVVGGFDEEVRIVQDWDFGLRISYAGCKMAWVKTPVFDYRLHQGQITRDASQIRKDYRRVLNKFFAASDLPNDLRALQSAANAHAYLKGAARAYEAGQWEDGMADLDKAVKLDPSLLDDRARSIVDHFVAQIDTSEAAVPLQCLYQMFEHLPASADIVRRNRNTAMARLAMRRVFRAYAAQDVAETRRYLVQALTKDATWLLNRGVRAIILYTAIDSLLRSLRLSRTSGLTDNTISVACAKS